MSARCGQFAEAGGSLPVPSPPRCRLEDEVEDAQLGRAPGEPGWFSWMSSDLGDYFQGEGRTVVSMAAGAREAVGGLVQLARTANTMDPRNVAHSQQAVQNASTLAAGTANLVNPYQGVKTMANVDGRRGDPARAAGSCVPDAIASLAGGAEVSSRAASGVRRVASAAGDATRATRALRFAPTHLLDKYHGEHLPGNDAFGTPVRYLSPIERQDYKLHVVEDGLLGDVDGELFDTPADRSVHSADPRAIFVMERHGEIFASNHQAVGQFHHSSFLGGPVAAAGELGVTDGTVHLVSNNSGHYQPSAKATEDFMVHQFGKDGKGAVFDPQNSSSCTRWGPARTKEKRGNSTRPLATRRQRHPLRRPVRRTAHRRAGGPDRAADPRPPAGGADRRRLVRSAGLRRGPARTSRARKRASTARPRSASSWPGCLTGLMRCVPGRASPTTSSTSPAGTSWMPRRSSHGYRSVRRRWSRRPAPRSGTWTTSGNAPRCCSCTPVSW